MTQWHVRRLLPADCAIVKSNTPIFSWTQPGDKDPAVPWTFNLRRANGTIVSTNNPTTPRILISSPTLPAGDYLWEVSYTTTTKKVVTSAVRRFNIPATAGLINWPTGQAFATSVKNKSRPRLLPAGSSFSSIAATAKLGEYKGAFEALNNTAINARTAPMLVEPATTRASFTSTSSYVSSLNNLKNDVVFERTRIEALGLMGEFSGKTEYTTAGINRLLNLASWSPTGISSEANQDQANREIYLALAQGLDLFSAHLKPDQVSTIVTALKDRLSQAQLSIKAIDAYPYHPHALSASQYVLEALMYSAGTAGFPESEKMLASAYETLLSTINTFQTDDGGYGNGVAYGWYTMIRLPETIAAMRIMGNIDLTQHPAVGQFGNFLVAFTAPNGLHPSAFGDESNVENNYQRYAWQGFRLYATLTRNPVHEWYWRADAGNISKVSYPGAWPFMTLGLKLAPLAPVAPTNSSWFFPDAGLAALHSTSGSPLRSSVLFRSSRFGSFNHSYADQNSFSLISNGKALLISGGYYPYYMSPHHATVTRSTRYKNALTVDGGLGQAEPLAAAITPGKPIESMDTPGRIMNAYDNGQWAVVTGDAALAYRTYDSGTKSWKPLLDDAMRSIAYHRATKTTVIYDWATSAKSRRWELNFNSQSAFALDGTTARVTNGVATACIDIYGAPGGFVASKGFSVPPEITAADHYQLRFSTSAVSPRLAAVTVIRENCGAPSAKVTFTNTTKATVNISGASTLSFDQATVEVP
ncbi:heparinase II/III-family protein [Paucibacter sp. TC2R-5]|uniref:heparinase II/III-family protein n=1 Tax=Paucibacter sp. TC2R-5 TaxID=2893555 RepID=UPI0021E47D97|nr:heparinase II/III-family protein [Paucibacter sp. TC2R-5]MCV2361765.1 heparinase II/III-family protein [Paucibacter sp. TC2R-5]